MGILGVAFLLLALACGGLSVCFGIAFGRRAKRLGYLLPPALEPWWVFHVGWVAAFDLARDGVPISRLEPALERLRRTVFWLSRLSLLFLFLAACLAVAARLLAR